MPNNGNDINQKIDSLVKSIDSLITTIERGRILPSEKSHLYNGGTFERFKEQNIEEKFLRDLNSFTTEELGDLKEELLKQIKISIEQIKKDIALQKEKLEKETDFLKKADIEDEIYKLKEEERALEESKNKDIKEFLKERRKLEREKLKEEFKNFSKEKQKIYKNADRYANFRESEATYRGRANIRTKADELIYQSGLGNNFLGRGITSAIDRQRKIDNLTHFSNVLQNGGAQTIAKAMGGGSGLGKILGSLGGSLGGVSVAAAKVIPYVGAVVQALQMAWTAVKMFAQVVGAANAYITRLVNLQTDLNEMSYKKVVDVESLMNERRVEAVKYIGDLSLKQIEIQGQNLLQAVDIATKQFVKATEIAVGPLTSGINETAYNAANAYLDYEAQMSKFGLERGQRAGELSRFEQRRDIQMENFRNISSRELERIDAQFQYDTYFKALETYFAANKDFKGRIADKILSPEGLKYLITGTPGMIIDNLTRIDADDMVKNHTGAEGDAMKPMTLPNGQHSTSFQEGFDNALKLDKNYADWASEMKKYYSPIFDAIGAGQSEKYTAISKNKLQPELFKVLYSKEFAQWHANVANEIASQQEQIGNKQVEIATQVAEKYIEASTEVKKMWLQLAQKTEQWLDKFDQTTNDLGVSLGITNRKQLEDYQNSMFSTVQTAAKFGKTIEDAVEMQRTYIETTGRNKIMGQSDYGNLFGLGKYLGDNGLAANYASQMEIFNVGVSDSVDMISGVLDDVNKIGLNGRKYTKTVVDNLKLAEKYQFKQGSKSLMQMAKWAENTRFNMSSLSGMLDKISEGGLEGVITQGAQFQVLGGHAAMNADPIAMMYERYADPEAFAKRMQDMTKGYGRVDKTTGETKFSGNELMMMEQLAKIQGRSVEDVQNEVRARNKLEVVGRQLNGNFDEDQQAFISNNASYNRETGQFQVKVKGANGEFVNKDVNQLTEADLKNIMPEEHNKRMEEYMESLIHYAGIIAGEEESEKGYLGQATMSKYRESYLQRVDIAHRNFIENFETYVNNSKEGMELANQKFSDYIAMWQSNEQAQGPGLDQINAATSNIANALGDTALVISEANKKIEAAVNYGTFGENGNVSGNTEEIPFYLNPIHNLIEQLPKPVWQQKDGIIRGNNSSIISTASNVTKINDGLVQSDPKDVAIFAKEGGVIGNFLNDLYNDIHTSKAETNNIKLEISGNLELSSGGQSINVISELQNNPILLRTLLKLIAEGQSSAENGGRSVKFI